MNKKIELLNQQHDVFENRMEMIEDIVQKLIEENRLIKEMVLLQNEVLKRSMDSRSTTAKPEQVVVVEQAIPVETVSKNPVKSFTKLARRIV